MVRVSSEPRRMLSVIGRRSNSFWRAAMVRSRLILIDENDSPPPVNGFREHFLYEFFRGGLTAASPLAPTRTRQRTARHGQNRPPLQLPQRPATPASAQVLSFLRRKVARGASHDRDRGTFHQH